MLLEKTEYMTMIRKGRWKLVHFIDYDEGQLFDLEADPRETNNHWDDPACLETKQSLISEILNWRIRSDKKTQGFRRALAGISTD